MAAMKINVVVLLAISSLLMGIVMSRDIEPGHNLEARIHVEGGMMDCWSALLELKSCSNEIILFFLNGESYLGQDCCRAIRIITFQCWPSMLTSVGFTAQEGDILRGYCEASSSSSTAPPAQSPIHSAFDEIRV